MHPHTNHEQAIFLQALELGSPAERAAFLDGACRDNPELRSEIDALLAAHDRLGAAPGSDSGGLHLQQTIAHPSRPEAPGSGSWLGGRYKLLELIGEGGMGLVWMADQTEPVQRRVALKVIKTGMDSRQVVARFEAERQALALMDHPNIARVLDGGTTDDGRPFFVMELVKGTPITAYCDRNKLALRDRLDLFTDVCRAVQHAHQKGIIHRDIKPSNVLVGLYDGKPVVKVIDFGVAKATGQRLTDRTLFTGFGAVVGTLEYMSPEQAQLDNVDIDTRSDIYALGVLLYELLTGTTPLTRKRLKEAALLEVLRLIREEEPPKPSNRLSTTEELPSIAAVRGVEPAKLSRVVRGELDWIVMKALEKDRNRRYETANGFALDVQRFREGEPVLAVPPSSLYRLRKFARKNRVALTTVGALLLLLVAGIAGTTFGLIRAEHQRAEAEIQKTNAIEAAAAEKEAKEQAQQRLAQIEKGNQIITSIFTDLDIREVKEGTDPLEAVLARRLVKAAEQLEGEAVGDPVVVAQMQLRLGQSLLHLGYPQDSVGLFVKARVTFTTLLGAEHRDTLRSMSELASAYADAGNLELAIPLGEEALKLQREKLGIDDPDTLDSMSILAVTYHLAGNWKLALPIFEENLKLSQAKLGSDHHDTLICMGNLAGAYSANGKIDMALPLFEEALRLTKAKLGEDHPDTLTTMHALASAYRVAGNLELAQPLHEETLKLMKARLGEDHPETLRNMSDLAAAYQAAGKHELALPIFEECLKLTKAKHGVGHPETLVSMQNLALAHKFVGKPELALPLFEETLKLMKAKLGEDHPNTLICRGNLTRTYSQVGRFAEAVALAKEQVLVARKILPPASPQLDSYLAMAGRTMVEAKAFTEAEPVFRECLAIREKVQPDGWLTFNFQAVLGGVLLCQQKYAEAEPLLLKGYEGMKAREKTIPPQGRVRIPEAIDRLIELYTATNRPDEVKKWRAERARYPEAAPPPREN